MATRSRAKLQFLTAILLYGTLGVFVRHAALPSSLIALARSSIGTLFLLILTLCRRQRPDFAAVYRNWRPLLLGGALLGLNWVTLFEAYRYTSVAVATLCTYMNPLIIVPGAAILFRERLSARRLLCLGAALAGMVFVSGVTEGSLPAGGQVRGIGYGLLTAALYGTIVLSNKCLRDISASDRTLVQLFVATLVLLPYCILNGDFIGLQLNGTQLLLLLVLGILHTGFAYSLYFGAMEQLPAQTLAILSYLDPVTALFCSALVLHEPLSGSTLLGAALILGAAVISELPARRRL